MLCFLLLFQLNKVNTVVCMYITVIKLCMFTKPTKQLDKGTLYIRPELIMLLELPIMLLRIIASYACHYAT